MLNASAKATTMQKCLVATLACLLIAAAFAAYYWPAPTYRVTGHVTLGGKPPQWQSDSDRCQMLIMFQAAERKSHFNEVYKGEPDLQAGTYVIEQIPAGKYKVSIHLFDPLPQGDVLKFAYMFSNTRLIKEVAGDCNIDFDFDAPRKGKGKKKGPEPREAAR
jgi:hypothetical protein